MLEGKNFEAVELLDEKWTHRYALRRSGSSLDGSDARVGAGRHCFSSRSHHVLTRAELKLSRETAYPSAAPQRTSLG